MKLELVLRLRPFVQIRVRLSIALNAVVRIAEKQEDVNADFERQRFDGAARGNGLNRRRFKSAGVRIPTMDSRRDVVLLSRVQLIGEDDVTKTARLESVNVCGSISW